MDMFKKTSRELRKYGITMAIACAVFGSIFWWKDHHLWQYFYGISGFFLVFGLILPKALAPIEWGWMKVAHAMGIVMTYILLTLTYLLVITPIGLLMKILGKNPLKRKFDPQAATYWVTVDPEGPTSRPDKPY